MKITFGTIMVLALWMASKTVAQTNIALGKPATASSEEKTERAASMANDDNLWTRWSASNGSKDQWWQVDLQSPTQIAACEITWEKNGQPYQYVIEGSLDGHTWAILSDQSASTDTRQTRLHQFRTCSPRYVRVRVTTLPPHCWASIYEVKLFATVPPPPPAAPAETAPVATTNNTTPSSAPGLQLGDTELQPGKIARIQMPLSASAWTFAKSLPVTSLDRRDNVHERLRDDQRPDQIELGIAVPAGFDPRRSWPTLVVNVSGDTPGSIRHMNSYYKPATEAGWVVLATDTVPVGKGPTDVAAMRWAAMQTALEYLHKQWPASKTWRYVCAGFSGGAKMSGYFGALMVKNGYNLIGMYFVGCNEDMASEGIKLYNPPVDRFKTAAVFLSTGNADKYVSAAQLKAVCDSLKRRGFTKLRTESFEGGHTVHQPHISEGLAWILQQAPAPAPAALGTVPARGSISAPTTASPIPVTFTYENPKARAVYLAGDFNRWNAFALPMQKDSSGVWTITVPLVPGRVQYKFVVDGVWVADPSNPEKGVLGPGGPSSVRMVSP